MRILLVEDDPTTSRSIELMLTHANLNVYCTDMGEDGIDLAKLYDYDLILLDLNLPRMDGREVLQHIKTDAQLRRIPVVILTTSKAEEDILRSYDLYANCYVTKSPVDFDNFIEVIRSIDRFWLALVTLPPKSDE